MNERPCFHLVPNQSRCYLGRLTYLTCTGCSGYYVHPEPQEIHWMTWQTLRGQADTRSDQPMGDLT